MFTSATLSLSGTFASQTIRCHCQIQRAGSLSYIWRTSRGHAKVSWRLPLLTKCAAQTDQEQAVSPDACSSWAGLGIDPRLIEALMDQGMEQPSAVQQAAIPQLLSGANCAVQSYTGSGKTLAYLLPALTRAISEAEREAKEVKSKGGSSAAPIHVLVVAPSRELAMQIVRVAQSLLPEAARSAVQQCIGGANIRNQIEALKVQKPIMVVGTPGRLAEHSRAGRLSTHQCSMLVLDEVDQLLAPQFRDDMSRIVQHTGRRLPSGPQTVVVSATLDERTLQQAREWCPNAVRIALNRDGAASAAQPSDDAGDDSSEASASSSAVSEEPRWGWGKDSNFWGPRPLAETESSFGNVNVDEPAPALPPTLRHVFVATSQRHRVDAVRRCIHALDAQKALVFMNHQRRLQDTVFKLSARNMPCASLHGEMSKQQRQNVLTAFRQGEYRALVVSDVAARGLDIVDCDAVFNLELPSNAAHYAHRAGRTGRMGRAGSVVTLIEPNEQFVVNKFAKRLQISIEEAKVEGGKLLSSVKQP